MRDCSITLGFGEEFRNGLVEKQEPDNAWWSMDFDTLPKRLEVTAGSGGVIQLEMEGILPVHTNADPVAMSHVRCLFGRYWLLDLSYEK